MLSLYVICCIANSVEALRLNALPINDGPLFDKELDEASEGEDDAYEGGAKLVFDMLKDSQITQAQIESVKIWSLKKEHTMTARMKALHMLAVKEEEALGKDMSKISLFGRSVPKYPRSWVNKIMNLPATKNFRYMFSGGLYRKKHFRLWLEPWVKKHFGNEDYFRVTDANNKSYHSLGAFDHSTTSKGFLPADCGSDCMRFDESYWATMKQSKFILAPGGDRPFSYRFSESFLTGSIPIINSIETDWSGVYDKKLNCCYEVTRYVTMIKYDYQMASDYPHKFDAAVADLNLRKFIRYQTFVEGDNDPETDEKNGFIFGQSLSFQT